MAFLTLIIHESDGVQLDYAVPFSYIKKDYIRVYQHVPDANGRFTVAPELIDYMLIDEGRVRLKTPVPGGSRVIIRRETYDEGPLVDYQDAAILVEEDLDLAALQALHVAQEAHDSYIFDLLKAVGELDDKKADRIHAPQHAKGAEDHVHPRAIGALEHPPATGKNYLANSNGWVEYIQGGNIMAPAAVLVQYFEGNGVDTEFHIDHPFNTANVTCNTYQLGSSATNAERVHFTEHILGENRVTLKSAEPVAAGIQFRAVLIAIGNGDGNGIRREYVHKQNIPAVEWKINHMLGLKLLKVMVFDSDGSLLIPDVDYGAATETELTLRFYTPVAGTAVLTL